MAREDAFSLFMRSSKVGTMVESSCPSAIADPVLLFEKYVG
jgi:hypothetical protein